MKKKGYSETLRALEDLVERMNRGDIPVDRLGESMREASLMIKTLRKSLKSTEAEISEILKSMDEAPPDSD